MNLRKLALLIAGLALALVALACSLPFGQSTETRRSIPTGPAPASNGGPAGQITAAAGGTLELAGGVQLVIPPAALSQDAVISISDSGKPAVAPAGSPLHFRGEVYNLDLGGAKLNQPAVLNLPLGSETSPISASTETWSFALLTKSAGDNVPTILPLFVEGGAATAHVYKDGMYVIVGVAVPLVASYPAPLHVPSYPQMTPAWCSPTAMTDLAQYHQGAWPAGGDGSLFGESSNWYLAGKAGQPFDSGFFFHQLLAAGGFDVPVPIGTSFLNSNMEVMIWYFNTPVVSDRAMLWPFFKAFVENFVWGYTGEEARPVAWGSAIAGHSRVITGSDGSNFTYNETGDGTANHQKSWNDYKTQAMTLEDGEIVDTVVFHFPPRPEAQRRGVIWLVPGDNGSMLMRSAANLLSSWVWDGANGHALGYYYDDKQGSLPDVPVIDNAFEALTAGDKLDYTFKVYNISTGSYTYHMHIDLIPDGGGQTAIYDKDTDAVASYASWSSANSELPLLGKPAGMYTLKYTLKQGGVINDVKYVQFEIKPLVVKVPDVVLIPIFTLDEPGFCRKGPGVIYPDITGLPAGEQVKVLGRNEDGTWLFVLWEKFQVKCWIGSAVGHADGDVTGTTVMPAPPPPPPTATPAPHFTPTPTARRTRP